MNLRDAVMVSYELGKFVLAEFSGKRFKEMASVLRYASDYPSHKRRQPVDVPALVAKWNEAVVGLTLSHSKKELDEWEYLLNELLTPLLTAPVKQVRQFYADLVTALKANERVPFYLWRMFECWGQGMIADAKDGQVIKLKTALAEQIARLVEADVKPQIADAIIGALQWRPAEALEKVKEALQAGKKAKLVGRESCLFLQVGDETVML